MIQARVLVDAVELRVVGRDETLDLRVEIFESVSSPNCYSVRIWRIEYYRIQATFPQSNGLPSHPPSDESILKEFEGIDLSDVPRPFENAMAARAAILAELEVLLDAAFPRD